MAVAQLTPLSAAPARPGRWILWLAALVALVAALSPRDLWAPDEPRYGLVARTMADTGEVLVPRLNGQVYAEKPPLLFWSMAGVAKVVGSLPAPLARLPAALLAVVAVFSVARLARRWFGDPDLGDTAGILFATTGLILWNSSRAALDLPMTAFSLLALEAATTVVAKASTKAALLAGLALGLGFLTKGPHVVFLPVCAVVGGCLAVRRARRLLDWRWLLVFGGMAAVFAAWLVPALAQAGDETIAAGETFRERLLGQLSKRLAGENEPHAHGPFWLAPLLLAFGLPWTLAWLPALPRAFRFRAAPEEERFGLGAALGGLLGTLVLLSIPTSKRELYLIPTLAPAAILAAWGLHRLDGGWYRVHLPRIFAALGFLGAAAAIAVPFARLALSLSNEAVAAALVVISSPRVVSALGGVAVLSLGAGLLCARARGRPVEAARAVATALGACWIVVACAILPAFDAQKSFAPLGAVVARQPAERPLLSAGFTDTSFLWGVPRDRVEVIGIAEGSHAEAARRLAPGAPPILLVIRARFRDDALRLLEGAPAAAWRDAVVLWDGLVGEHRHLLLTNAPTR